MKNQNIIILTIVVIVVAYFLFFKQKEGFTNEIDPSKYNTQELLWYVGVFLPARFGRDHPESKRALDFLNEIIRKSESNDPRQVYRITKSELELFEKNALMLERKYRDLLMRGYEEIEMQRQMGQKGQTSEIIKALTAQIKSRHRDNFCLDVPDADMNNGRQLHAWSCHGGDNQQFIYDNDTQQIKIKHSGKCLDVAEASQNNGGIVHQWDCHGGDNQKWKYDNGKFNPKHAPGKCLDIVAGGKEDGSLIQIWDCHGGTNQQWDPVLYKTTQPPFTTPQPFLPPQTTTTQPPKCTQDGTWAGPMTSNVGEEIRRGDEIAMCQADGSWVMRRDIPQYQAPLGEVLLTQPLGGKQVLLTQPLGGEQVLRTQPLGGEQVLRTQPLGGEQVETNVWQCNLNSDNTRRDNFNDGGRGGIVRSKDVSQVDISNFCNAYVSDCGNMGGCTATLTSQPEMFPDTCTGECNVLMSKSKEFGALLLPNGNLQVQSKSGKILWQSDSGNRSKGPYKWYMQNDGNIVIYDSNNVAIWASNTGGRTDGPFRLDMQDDYNLVAYNSKNEAIWASRWFTG